MDTFDASQIVAQKTWLDKAIDNVAPSWGLSRLESRVSKALFEYNAARTNRIYNPRKYGQVSESPQTVRDRIIMMWEARDLRENVPEMAAASRCFGINLTPTEYSPMTGDREYNAEISAYFHSWCKNADVTGRHSFKKLIQLAAEERPVDGDCGFVIRRFGDGLKIQLVPATRIGNPNQQSDMSENYYQGVCTNDYGQPVAYRIFRVDRSGVYFDPEDVPAENFAHYFDPFRVDQMRGVTDWHSGIRTARSLYEILEAEKAGVRFASQQAALVFSERGTANPRNLFTPNPAITLSNGQQQQNELSDVGMIRYFGNADKIEVMPSRPSQAFTGFVQHLMHEIALSCGIPQAVLFGSQGYQGPSVRAEFAAADRVFTRHQGVLTDKVLDPIKNAVLIDAIARKEIAPPALLTGETMVQGLRRATCGEWRFPAKLSIDVGRESAANLNENRQGAKSLAEIASEEGTDAFSRLEQIAIEASFIKELSTKYGVPETAIRLVTNSLPSTPAAAAAAGDNVGASAAQAQVDSSGSTTAGTGGASAPDAIAGVETFPDVSAAIAPLNGAQIAAVLSIVETLRAGDLTPEAAESLMISAGMAAESARIVARSVAAIPKVPTKITKAEMHRRILLAKNDSDSITINLADGSYIPNDAMVANAKRSLAVREKATPSNRGMTAVGLARARDIINKRPLSEDTVRRMKAYFDRHEIDKQGSTWSEQGKGWQAWNGWGGDAGRTWANAIVERINKADTRTQAGDETPRVELSAKMEVERMMLGKVDQDDRKQSADEWLNAVIEYQGKFASKLADVSRPITNGRSIIELSKKQFDLPTPDAGENHDDFMVRCMADPVSTAEFPDAEQRTAVCMRQHENHFAKVGKRGAIVASDKAPKSDTPNKNPHGEGSAKGDASGKSAEVTKEQEVTLQNKADEFNAKETNTRNGRATLGQLKSVFQRGLGAFTGSHSPTVSSAPQWAFARVNAYLYLLKNGRPENPKYVTDYDLLPSAHPKSGK